MAGNVRVICRTRPLNRKELDRGGYNILHFSEDGGSCTIQSPTDERSKHTFNFDYCFPPTTSQEQVYDVCAQPILEDVFKGYNGTLFVYGQTGSGLFFGILFLFLSHTTDLLCMGCVFQNPDFSSFLSQGKHTR